MGDEKGNVSLSVEFFRVSSWSFSFLGEGSIKTNEEKSEITLCGKRIWGGKVFLIPIFTISLLFMVLGLLLGAFSLLMSAFGLIIGNIAAFAGKLIGWGGGIGLIVLLLSPIAYLVSMALRPGKYVEMSFPLEIVKAIDRNENVFKIKIRSLLSHVVAFETKGNVSEVAQAGLDKIFAIR